MGAIHACALGVAAAAATRDHVDKKRGEILLFVVIVVAVFVYYFVIRSFCVHRKCETIKEHVKFKHKHSALSC